MLNDVRNLGWRQVRCTAHSLNLQQQEIKAIKGVVEFSSSYALSKLEENQKQLNLPVLKLKQDCITRWNST